MPWSNFRIIGELLAISTLQLLSKHPITIMELEDGIITGITNYIAEYSAF